MKTYILPMGLATIGVALLFNYKSEAKRTSEITEIPATRFLAKTSSEEGSLKEPSKTDSSLLNTKISKTLGAKKTVVAFDQPYQFFHDRLVNLNECIYKHDCPFPQTDPKSYEVAVQAETVTTLQTLKKWQARHNYQDERISFLMKDFLQFELSAVKIEALSILATQTPNPDVLDPLLTHVISHPQPEAIPMGMKELTRYTSITDRKKIDATIEDVLLHGGVYSAIEVAKNLSPLITAQNKSKYWNIRQQLLRVPMADDIITELDSSLERANR